MQFSGAVASSPRLARRAVAIFALLCLMMVSAAQAQHSVARAEPAPLKAVIIVGPTDGLTGQNLADAEALALVAESYGMDVRRVFHPNATWEAVMANVEGANLVVYMGHGNGWPSPYAPFQENTKDGIGINPYAGGSNSNTKYYGAAVIRESWHLAPNAIVFLNHLCYGAGNGEPGMAIPNWDIAHQRSDNFASGFLAAGARTVFSYSWQLFNKTVKALFETNQTMEEMFMTPGNYPKAYYGWIGADARRLDSVRTPGTVNFLDRDPKDGFLRAVSGDLGMTAAQWRGEQSSNWTAPTVINVPTTPQGVNGTAFNNRVVKLTWSASSANHYGAVKYLVLRNGKQVAKGLTTTTYNDAPAKVGSYTYTIKAVDPAGVKSASSAPVTVTAVENAGSVVPTPSPTPSPTPTPTPTPSPSGSPAPTPTPTPVSPPSVPQNLAGTPNSNMQVSLTWSPSTASVAGTLRYRAFRNGTAIGSKTTSLAYTDQPTVAGTYKYEVRSIDAAGNLSAKSPPIWVSVTSAEDPPSVSTDTERPSNPDGLTAQPMSGRRVALSWNASTDNSGGPITYKVFRGKKLIKTLSSTSFVDQPAYLRTFRYRVKAVDAAGNRSYFSPAVYVTTIA